MYNRYNNSSEANLNALAAANLFKDYDSLLLIQNQFVELTKAAAKLAEQSITIQSEIQQVVSQEKDGTKKLELAKELKKVEIKIQKGYIKTSNARLTKCDSHHSVDYIFILSKTSSHYYY